jgi:hypothetical protein
MPPKPIGTVEQCPDFDERLMLSDGITLAVPHPKKGYNLPLPNEDFGRPDELFVDLSECVFEALFKGVST